MIENIQLIISGTQLTIANHLVEFLLINIGLSLLVAIVSFGRVRSPGAGSLIALSLVVMFWSLGHLFFNTQWISVSQLTLVSVIFLCSTMAATIQFVFSLAYARRTNWVSPWIFFLFIVQPVITQMLFWVEPWREIFFRETNSSILAGLSTMGIWGGINSAYIYVFQLASVLLFTDTFVKNPRKFFFQSGIILVSSIVPLIVHLLSEVQPLPRMHFNHSVLGYSITMLGFAYCLYRRGVIEFIPITRDVVVDGMSDGWMVLDQKNNIIDINPAAESIVGLMRRDVYGKPVSSVLADWPKFDDTPGGVKELDMKRSIKTNTDWRYLNIRLSNLRDKDKASFGKLIVWRDITERRLTDDARQRARDEMFVILNAISNAASNATTQEGFLSETIYQIIYSFQSQVVAVFLVEENKQNDEMKELSLVSHFGLTPDTIQSMATISVPTSMFEWVVTQKRPFLTDEMPNDIRVRFSVRGLGISNFIIIPLITHVGGDSKTIGCLCMARKEQILYGQDEIARITAIADQVATLIDADRRRQLAIALVERQRLLRDLHDSVSQKLYGLLTLTEAAQAAFEAGSPIVPSEVLSRIGDNARLALKEMRLFLFEMQPVELEKEGLIFVLHHRLAAVEGRADTKARLLADENISLSKEKEIALYYVAQEALNNVLKHARAPSVTVVLKQSRRGVILDVVDDGRGFDPKKLERGGMGLQNMKDRISQVGGKIKIESKPGVGTKVRVTVSQGRVSSITAKRKMK